MKSENPQINFSGIVVTFNEERRLWSCLNSIFFCDELIVVDLGSKDNSVKIAQQYGAKILRHHRVAVVEEVLEYAISFVKNEWVILLDPDEVLPDGIVAELRYLITNDPDLGVIFIPWQFYFKNEPLYSTVWGVKKHKGVVRHVKRNCFHPLVHRGIKLKEGFTSEIINGKDDVCIRHYWIDSYGQLFKKHWRYIKREGQARYVLGERFTWLKWMRDTIRSLKRNLIDYRGGHGGFDAIFLSFFYACYINMGLLSLKVYQLKMKKLNQQ